MVQFGGGLSSGGSASGGRNQPFRTLRSPRFNLRNVLLLLVTFFVLRNLLKNDYRKEEIQYLRDSGMAEKQIQQYIDIPKTVVEQEKNDELEKIKNDIAYLLKEVEQLKAGGRFSEENKPDTGRGGSLTSMDRMHEEKRRMKEEQLIKDHPNFKPSKRLQDSLPELQREPKME